MKKINKFVEHIADEICGAKHYAEKYLEYKSVNNSSYANKYKEMALDELKHATYIHDIAMNEIDILSKVYTPPEEMQEEWDRCHIKYVEKVAWIKQMLSM